MQNARFEIRRTELSNLLRSFGWEISSEVEEDIEGLWKVSLITKTPSGDFMDAIIFFDGTVLGFVSGVRDAAEEYELEEIVSYMGIKYPSDEKQKEAKTHISNLADGLERWGENYRALADERSAKTEPVEYVLLRQWMENFDYSRCTISQLRAASRILSSGFMAV